MPETPTSNEIRYQDLRIDLIRGLANFPAVEKGLEELGVAVRNVEDSPEALRKALETPPDLVLSLHFNVEEFRLMKGKGIPFAMWTPDKLLINETTLPKDLAAENLFLFTFDPEDLEAFRRFGFRNSHYLPLNSGLEGSGWIGFSGELRKRFACDVSFVGDSITVNHNPYFQFALNVSNLLKCLNEVAEEQSRYFTENVLKPLYHEKQKDRFSLQYLYDYLYSLDRRTLDFVLGCEASSRMRKRLISLLDGFDVRVYGDEFWHAVQKGTIKTLPRVDYRTEMPAVFSCSKVNLNLSRTFFAGTIQRVFDVLYCGGFLLTDYRPDLEKLFRIGEDLDVFRTDEELVEKVRYYLAHDEERTRIARQGQETVMTRHRVADRLKTLIAIVLSPNRL